MENLLNTLITQFPNFVGFITLAAVLIMDNRAKQRQIEALISEITKLARDCDCHPGEAPAQASATDWTPTT